MSVVQSVSLRPTHLLGKIPQTVIQLQAGHGVVGDCHGGATVKHRSRVARDPSQPNLRQVHLIHAELLQDLAGQGFSVSAGDIGENILTRDLDLLALPSRSRLRIGASAVVEITGLRNPCHQLDQFLPGLMAACLIREPGRPLVRLAGVMGVVISNGEVRPGDPIQVEYPLEPHTPLQPV
jgi:MOSC domain-containing protein YiiM